VFRRAELVKTIFSPGDYPPPMTAEFAFAGRSNVGKSTLLNALLGVKLAHVSGTPGKTASINFYRVDNRFFFVDLPGYGFARRSRTELERWRQLVEDYFARRAGIATPVVLIDIRHSLQKADMMMLDYLKARQLAFITVLTKRDKLSGNQFSMMLSYHEKQARSLGALEVFPVSAVSGRGIQELRKGLEVIARNYSADKR